MKMDGPELLLAASGGILAASAAVCLIRCRGRLRKILAVWTGVFAGALLTLALGGWLLARAELEWRGWVICVLYHAALAGVAGIMVCIVRCLGQLMEERRKWLRRCWTAAVSAAGVWLLLMAALLGFVTFALATEERVVDWPEQKVVEVDRSWLDPCYVYYEYRGPLVRGAGALTTSQRPLPGP